MNRPGLQLLLQTSSLVVGFMVWVILSSLMPFISNDIHLNSGDIALITAAPVILGSLLRVPIGYWTNRFGARILFFISFIVLLFPVYYVSKANSMADLMIGGLLIGVGGAVFSVGVTSLPKYYPKEKHGFVNGIYGAGNIGTAIISFAAPVVANLYGWRITVNLFLILLVAFALFNFLFGDRKEPKVNTPLMEQIKGVYRNSTLWFLCLFYFITFGAFVAFTIYLPNFLVNHFELDKVDAGMRTAGFIAIATILRPVGGWLGDKINAFFILMLVFFGLTFSGFLLSFTPSLTIYTIGCLAVAICSGIGNGAVFKLVPMYFSKQAGIVNGIVAAMGGLGGFFPPIVLTILFDWTGHYAIGFMALSEFSLASLILVIWMYYKERLFVADNVLNNTAAGLILTDPKGKITRINPAFTAVTGYTEEEVIGKTPGVLRSGKHHKSFYDHMWKNIMEKGFWQGEIWNKRKNGETYLELLTISAIKNEAGEVKYYAGMFNDLSRSDV
ncbi:NNP family nitrate/nitrite transporter-like MFS transporter [Oikeobacillus pervagus]|uniref:NNP family nitrate/nitrite transporter-like MFS transporter n=1 Tax=Oikeobacillus pervagus TaxID=1325931 RepID=A0AAJ1WGU7_9BACI|nr:nitrate/nitrite transporter [Oikeobacillus pervagus]MDQ0215492.1 NNP family nitrate/nitrite transporter-like MFS transporter [Oikeobacillus pervagus]